MTANLNPVSRGQVRSLARKMEKKTNLIPTIIQVLPQSLHPSIPLPPSLPGFQLPLASTLTFNLPPLAGPRSETKPTLGNTKPHPRHTPPQLSPPTKTSAASPLRPAPRKMRLFLIPISTKRTLLYAQRLTTTTPPSHADKLSARAAKMWLSWV